MNQAGKTVLPCNSLRRFTFAFSRLRKSVISLSSCSWSVGNNITSRGQVNTETSLNVLFRQKYG